MVSQPYRFRTPAVRQPRTNSAQLNPGSQAWKGQADEQDSSDSLGSGIPAWEPTDQLGKPERLPWLKAMDGVVWERLTRIPRRRGGLPYGWGPHAVRAAYVRRFGRPPHWDRGRWVYAPSELLAVADLLEAEAAAWGAGR